MKRWLAFALLVACGGESPEPPPPPVPRFEPHAVDAIDAFDLVPTGDGAVLAWGRTRVLAIALDGQGHPRGAESVLDADDGAIEELAITHADGRLAALWIARTDDERSARATIASAGIEGFATARVLGASPAGRGRLGLWALPGGGVLASYQVESVDCQSGRCARVHRARLDQDLDPSRTRGGGSMEIPEPCERLLIGGLMRGPAWFSSLCHLERGAPSTTLYAIYPAISFAAAPELATGCEPVGLGPGAQGAIAFARCAGDALLATEVDSTGRILARVERARRTVSCAYGRPALGITGTDSAGTIELPLTESLGRLEALLPESVAPRDARAVWTGETILVAAARPRGDRLEVALDRFRCQGSDLVRVAP